MTIDHTAARIGDLMSQYPAWAPYLAMKVARGDLTEDEGQLRHDLDVEDARLRPLPNDQWGRPHITWDLDPARWHYAEDGCTPAKFSAAYPDLILARVTLSELEAALADRARRHDDPFAAQYLSKTRRLIAHLNRGGLVTPALITQTTAGLAVTGGNHRLGWAKFTGATEAPILISAGAEGAMRQRMPSLSLIEL